MEQEIYELTIPQKSILDGELYFPGSTHQNLGGYVVIHCEIDAETIKEAFLALLKTNDACRIKLTNINGEYFQYVDSYKEQEVEYLDFEGNEDAFQNFLKQFIRQKVFQCDGFLYRFVIFKEPGGRIGFAYLNHHMISDGFTLIKHFITRLLEFCFDEEKRNSEEIYSYIEFVKSQHAYRNSEKWKDDEVYWKKKLEEYHGEAAFTQVKDLSCKNIFFKLGSEVTSQLGTFCKQNRVSVYNVFMGAILYYKACITNNQSVVVGTPILNRSKDTDKKTMGMYVNTLPMFLNIKEDWTVVEYLKEVQKQTFRMYQHLGYSYHEIRNHYYEMTGEMQNLLEIMFSYQNVQVGQENVSKENYELKTFPRDKTSDIFQINVYDFLSTGSLSIEYKFQKQQFTEKEMYLVHNRLVQILKDFMKYPDKLIMGLSIMDDEERRLILEKFNQTDMNFDCLEKQKTIVDIFEEEVEKHPDNVACICGDGKLTYRELNSLANQIANMLIEKGLKKEQVVGILLSRSKFLVASILGVLKAGGAYLPMDPDHPDDRISYMIEDSNAAFVLTEMAFKQKVQAQEKVIQIDNVPLDTDENPNSKSNAGNLCYVIYTSGSTGKPKGVMIEHRNVLNFVESMEDAVSLTKYKTILGLTTISFDIFGLEVWGSLLKGLTLVLTKMGSQMDGSRLASQLRETPVDIIQATPSRMALLMQDVLFLDMLKTVKVVLIGGEAFPEDLLSALQKYKNLQIINVYGPTETTIWSTLKDVTDEKEISIGKPIGNTQIYILSGEKLCGVGVVGEICIGGDGVGRGYLNREELTREKFISNPYGDGQIYRTGDLGKWRSDGTIECLGRVDDQVKIRGLRIELGEIVQVIKEQPEIKDVAVIVRKRGSGELFLYAYVVGQKELDLKSLKESLYAVLPAYMVPQYFMQLDALPLNQNGKVDKKALPEITYQSTEEYCEARTVTEQKVVRAFEQIFEMDKVSVYDKFGELGGNSLIAIKLHVELEKLGYQIEVTDINKYQTVEKIAAFLDGKISELDSSNDEKKKVQTETKEGSICLCGIEPFNEFYYRSCFYNAAFVALEYFHRDVLYYLVSTVISYELEKDQATGYEIPTVRYIERESVKDVFAKDGIGYKTKDEKKSFVQNVKDALEQKHPVVVGVDYFYESIRKDMYKKEHGLHFLLIYGYHPEHNVFYIMEHFHRDNLSYEGREISCEDLQLAHEKAYKLDNMQEQSPLLYFEFYEQSTTTASIVLDNLVASYVEGIVEKELQMVSGLAELKRFIGIYEELLHDSEEQGDRIKAIVRGVNAILNAKAVQQYKVEKVFGADSREAASIRNIVDCWESIRIQLAKCMYLEKYSSKRLEKVKPYLETIMDLEQKYIVQVQERRLDT